MGFVAGLVYTVGVWTGLHGGVERQNILWCWQRARARLIVVWCVSIIVGSVLGPLRFYGTVQALARRRG